MRVALKTQFCGRVWIALLALVGVADNIRDESFRSMLELTAMETLIRQNLAKGFVASKQGQWCFYLETVGAFNPIAGYAEVVIIFLESE